MRRHDPPYFLGYLLLHALVVVGLTTPEFPDSTTYMHLSLTGGDLRLPTVPLLYKLLPDDPLRVAGQTVLAAAAWWILATSAGRLVSDRRIRLGLMAVLLTLGLVRPIVSWNTVILSESVAISLTALMIGCWLRYVSDIRWGTAAPALAATLFWTFTRQPNVFFGLLITIAAIVAAVAMRPRNRYAVWVAVALTAISVAGVLELRHNQRLSQNTLMYMIKGRILANHGWTVWFARHGMPNPQFDPAEPGRAAARNPQFQRWVEKRGIRTYVEFVATHPRYTLLDPLPYLTGEEASLYHTNAAIFPQLQPDPTPAIFSPDVNYGRHRDVVPSVVRDVLFDHTQIGSLLLLAIPGFALGAWVWRRRGFDRRFVIPVFIVVTAIPQAYLVWLSGGEATHELDRLSMVTAVWLRIGLWLLLAFALDAYLSTRREPRTD